MKLSFFTKLYYAITDFRLYPYVVQKEKLRNAFGYFLCFAFFVSIILSGSIMMKTTNWLKEFVAEYQEQINEFEIKEGELTVHKNMDIDFLRVKIYTDDNKNIDDVDFRLLDISNYQLSILAFKDAFAIGNQGYGYLSINYQESNINIDKQGVYDLLLKVLHTPSYRISLMLVLVISLFITFSITRLIYVLLIAFMLLLLGFAFRMRYRLKEYIKVAFYIITLPTITEVIALICVGELNDYATITYYLLCYVYMFYAVRALKLDNILTTTQEKIMSMKSEAEKANSMLEQEKKNKTEDNHLEESENKDAENKKEEQNENDKKES